MLTTQASYWQARGRGGFPGSAESNIRLKQHSNAIVCKNYETPYGSNHGLRGALLCPQC